MPIYHYKCQSEKCNYDFYTEHSIHSDFLTKCEKCSKETLDVVIDAAPTVIDKTIKTFGSLLDQKDSRKEEAKAKEKQELENKRPPWRKTLKPRKLKSDASQKDIEHYVRTGEKEHRIFKNE